MRDRDRDAEGRARNARPRDALGRPLPYGAVGEERAPEGVVRTPAETLAEAQALLDAGRPFHAHEVLEDAWKSAPEASGALAGPGQLAVGLTHAMRGNARGGTLLDRGREHRGYAAPPHGIDVPGWCAGPGPAADAAGRPRLGAGGPREETPRVRSYEAVTRIDASPADVWALLPTSAARLGLRVDRSRAGGARRAALRDDDPHGRSGPSPRSGRARRCAGARPAVRAATIERTYSLDAQDDGGTVLTVRRTDRASGPARDDAGPQPVVPQFCAGIKARLRRSPARG